MTWGNAHEGKQIKEARKGQQVFTKGNWGAGPANLGLYGFRGTAEENAWIGKQSGQLGGRPRTKSPR